MKKSIKDYSLLAGVILGAIFLLLSYLLIKHVIINWKMLLLVWLSIGSSFSLAWLLSCKHKIKLREFLGHTFLSSISIGSMFLFTFLCINNFASTDKQIKNYKIAILETGLKKGKYNKKQYYPYVLINIHGVEKRLVFGKNERVEDFKFISLITRNGFLGFEIIEGARLIN